MAGCAVDGVGYAQGTLGDVVGQPEVVAAAGFEQGGEAGGYVAAECVDLCELVHDLQPANACPAQSAARPTTARP
jgi:hypothetical protein